MMESMTLTRDEIAMGRNYLDTAMRLGADKCRITLTKSAMDLVATLDGQIDRITHNMDRNVTLALFKDKRYGTFSTNKLDWNADDFVSKALEAVAMLAEDPARDLPPIERTERSGEDAGLYNKAAYEAMTMEKRMEISLGAACFGSHPDIISEEGEYTDSLTDVCIFDSNGASCRHIETAFEYATEVTVRDGDSKVSAYWWDSALDPASLDGASIGRTALAAALAKRRPQRTDGGSMTVVVESECSSKLLAPILSAMNGFAIQQNNSFLTGRLGEKLFPEWLDIIDRPREKGATGARLFDTEGVATIELPLVEHGVLKNFFVTTFIANKTGMAPTIDDASRPCVLSSRNEDCDALVASCLKGLGAGEKGIIRITGFNGGNCNSATGDFSFGIEGFFVGPDGSFPVRECVMTGNMIDLWNHLLAVGNDPRPCRSRQVPSLVFEKVDISS